MIVNSILGGQVLLFCRMPNNGSFFISSKNHLLNDATRLFEVDFRSQNAFLSGSDMAGGGIYC